MLMETKISTSQLVRRRVVLAPVMPKETGTEIEISADATVFGVTSPRGTVSEGLNLVLGVVEGAAPVKRMVWVVPVGSEISAEAQGGQCLGLLEVYSLSVLAGGMTAVVSVVFLETQVNAVERVRHAKRRGV